MFDAANIHINLEITKIISIYYAFLLFWEQMYL